MITFPAAPAHAPADHASHAQTSHAFQIISCCSGVETNWMCSQSLSKWIMLQSVSELGLDYHLTQARQKKKKKKKKGREKNAVSTCHDGTVVYVSMTPSLLQRCISGLLITPHAVIYHTHSYSQSYAQTWRHSLHFLLRWRKTHYDSDKRVELGLFGICIICVVTQLS